MTESRVKVVVRVRPFLADEPSDVRCITCTGRDSVELRRLNLVTKYQADACFGETSTQEEIFAEVCPLTESVFKGINATVFAYGNTGAGKTFTMQGSATNPGITPRVVERLLSTKPEGAELTLSALEIYNEKLVDLLSSGAAGQQDLVIREDRNGPFVVGLTSVRIASMADFGLFFEQASRRRAVGATKLNHSSSRSHLMLSVRVSVPVDEQRTLTGKINLIDLAGSEDNRRLSNKGLRMAESKMINKSLFHLNKVVTALNTKGARVPYRESKLTRLLQDSLGGNCTSVMLANISPTYSFVSETEATLKFVVQSRNIVNTVVVCDEKKPCPSDLQAQFDEWLRKKNAAAPLGMHNPRVARQQQGLQKKPLRSAYDARPSQVAFDKENLLEDPTVPKELVHRIYKMVTKTVLQELQKQPSDAPVSVPLPLQRLSADQVQAACEPFQTPTSERNSVGTEERCDQNESELEPEPLAQGVEVDGVLNEGDAVDAALDEAVDPEEDEAPAPQFDMDRCLRLDEFDIDHSSEGLSSEIPSDPCTEDQAPYQVYHEDQDQDQDQAPVQEDEEEVPPHDETPVVRTVRFEDPELSGEEEEADHDEEEEEEEEVDCLSMTMLRTATPVSKAKAGLKIANRARFLELQAKELYSKAAELIPQSQDIKQKLTQLQTPKPEKKAPRRSGKELLLEQINTCTKEEMEHQLKLIGEKRAAAIVMIREANGPFESLEGLLSVPGFGTALFQKFLAANVGRR
eukprot:m51a1_g3969 putative kinesin family member 22 (746) ;mRNA; r:404080-407001